MPPKVSIKPTVKEEKTSIYEAEKIHRTIFTIEELHAVVLKYAEKQIENKKTSWASTLKNHLPELREEEQVHFIFSNDSQNKILEDGKEAFTSFLKAELVNDYIIISSEVVVVKKENTKSIDPVEKLDKMVKTNPKLLDLIKTFKLDL